MTNTNSKQLSDAALKLRKVATRKAAKDCRRCAGTGDWAPGRVCFACGGSGLVAQSTAEADLLALKGHVAEIREIVEALGCRLVQVRPQWTLSGDSAKFAARRAQLVELEAQLARKEGR